MSLKLSIFLLSAHVLFAGGGGLAQVRSGGNAGMRKRPEVYQIPPDRGLAILRFPVPVPPCFLG
jgi:hypothetical protein